MSRSSSNVEKLATGKIGRLLLEYSWPALVAMSLNALYAVVDRFYIGRGCGEAAMAGLTLTFPVMMAFGAFGVFVGLGHAAVLSIKLGENDRTAAEKLLGELVALKLLLFILLPPIVFFNLDTILGWCGGSKVSAEALASAKAYLKIVVFAHVFSHLAFGLSAAMRAEGAAIRSMICMAVGFGANLLLDPLFIFVFGMGIEGAAWATNISMAASALFAFHYYLRGDPAVRLRLARVRVYREFIWRTSGIGLAPFLQHLLGAAINVSLGAAFAKWAADEASATRQIASLGVMQSMLILVLMPIMGAQQGLQPIIGYNWGAHNYRRVRETVMTGLWMTTAIVVVACIIQTVPPFPEWMDGVHHPCVTGVIMNGKAMMFISIICVILCGTAVMALDNVTADSASTDPTVTHGGCVYTISAVDPNNAVANITAWDGETKDIVIPATIKTKITVEQQEADVTCTVAMPTAEKNAMIPSCIFITSG